MGKLAASLGHHQGIIHTARDNYVVDLCKDTHPFYISELNNKMAPGWVSGCLANPPVNSPCVESTYSLFNFLSTMSPHCRIFNKYKIMKIPLSIYGIHLKMHQSRMSNMCPLVYVDGPESHFVADGYTTFSVLLAELAVSHLIYSSLPMKLLRNM